MGKWRTTGNALIVTILLHMQSPKKCISYWRFHHELYIDLARKSTPWNKDARIQLIILGGKIQIYSTNFDSLFSTNIPNFLLSRMDWNEWKNFLCKYIASKYHISRAYFLINILPLYIWKYSTHFMFYKQRFFNQLKFWKIVSNNYIFLLERPLRKRTNCAEIGFFNQNDWPWLNKTIKVDSYL